MVKNYNELIETAVKSTGQIGEYPTEVHHLGRQADAGRALREEGWSIADHKRERIPTS